MSELLGYYQTQAKAHQSSLPWLAKLQQQALESLAEKGFPTRFDEDWKYTRVEGLLQQQFINPPLESVFEDDVASDAPVKDQIHLINGRVMISDALQASLPEGVLILPLAVALEEQEDKIKPYLSQSHADSHGFQALNTAMMQSGVFIYLPKGAVIEQPLLLAHWQGNENQAIHLRHVIVAEENAQATIVEDYRGLNDGCYFTNALTEVFTHCGARLRHYKIQRESRAAYHIGHLAVNQDRDSQFDSHSLSLGGKLVRSDIHIRLQQAGAACLMNGIYAPNEGQHIDHHTTVEHLVADCQSKQDYKGIMAGHSKAVFNGKVIVAKDAQHSHAQQQNKNILLSEHAEINTKPQLEIFADDVICSHGATVGQLDEEALFYLATRGIDRQQASAYLIRAFASENLALVSEPALAKWMDQLLTQQLG